MTRFCFTYSAVQLHMGMLTMIICQRRSQLQRYKEIILRLTKKERNMLKEKANKLLGQTRPYLRMFCVF